MEGNIEKLKKDYNLNLNRYYNGCEYLDKHPNDCNKFMKELIDVKEKIDSLVVEIEKHQNITTEEILKGFSL